MDIPKDIFVLLADGTRISLSEQETNRRPFQKAWLQAARHRPPERHADPVTVIAWHAYRKTRLPSHFSEIKVRVTLAPAAHGQSRTTNHLTVDIIRKRSKVLFAEKEEAHIRLEKIRHEIHLLQIQCQHPNHRVQVGDTFTSHWCSICGKLWTQRH